MKTILEKSFVTIELDTENNWLIADWKGYQTVDGIKEGCEVILETIKSTGVTKLLNNNQNVKGSWTQAADWVGTNWIPRALSAGLSAISFVYSPDVFARFSVDKLLTVNSNFSSNTFKEMSKAKEWLKTV